MIQPTNPISLPAQTADALWISNLVISAPSTTSKIRVNATITPMLSASGILYPSLSKQLIIPDVMSLAATDMNVANAMSSIFAVIQSQVTGQHLF